MRSVSWSTSSICRSAVSTTEACQQLLLEASEDMPHLGESVQSLAERSDRNPMFLLELVRRSRDRVDASVSGETTVPDTLRGFLAARIAALGSLDRELLETAACQGYEFDPVLIAEASGTGRVQALKQFARMEHGRNLLRAAGRQYRFQHHLVQEVLYADLHTTLRETYHAAIGDALERRTQPSEGMVAVTLCIHFLKGGLPLRARPYLRSAMEHLAWESVVYSAGEELAEMALAIEGLLTGEDRAFALELRGRGCIGRGRLDEAAAALEEAHALAVQHGGAELESDILVSLAWLALQHRRVDDALRCLEQAAARAHAARDVAREAATLSRLGVERTNLGQYDLADETARRAFDVLGDADEPFTRGRLLSDLASLRILQGRLEEGETLLAQAEQLAHEIGDVFTEFTNATERGRLAFRRGRFDRALAHLGASLELGRRMGMHHRDAFLLLNTGLCLLRLGHFDQAGRRLHESREMARRRGDPGMDVLASIQLGALHTARGALVPALDELQCACARTQERGLERAVVEGAVHHADLLALLGRFEEAERVLQSADAARADHGHPALGVDILAARARVLERAGRFEDALAHCEQTCALARRHTLLVLPHAFRRACLLHRTGRSDEAESGFRDVLASAREVGPAPLAVLAQAHLAGRAGGDGLAARVALEQHADRLTAVERIEAHIALWDANGEPGSLAAARQELETLVGSAPAGDRDAMRTRVEPFCRVTSAWAREQG